MAVVMFMFAQQSSNAQLKNRPFAYANFHEVTPGVLYRSKQLTAKQFQHYIRKFGIKTIINLRGTELERKWYQGEMAAVAKNSVTHYDVPLSSTRYIPPQVLDSLMSNFRLSDKPILVHCWAGADRTGLFCAAWKLKVEKCPPEEALKQLSVIYGHIPLFNSTRAMDRSFHDYICFLGYRKESVYGKRIWVRNP